MCREDVLFWINSFCLLFEPRREKKTTIPFNSWPHQDDVIAAVAHFLGKRDVGVNKSRGEGCSWLVLMVFLHRWLFDTKDGFGSYGLVSLNEDLVDDAKNPDSLMWKLDWQLLHLPEWMLPEGFNWSNCRSKTDHVLLNPETGATIKGFACTQNVASGGRKTAFLMDELGKWPRPQDSIAMTSTQSVTHSRIIVSTPFGNEGAYFDAIHLPSTMLKATMHWQDNIYRKRGLYQWDTVKDKLRKLDLDYDYKKDYPFCKDGKIRSPWYDAECRRANATPKTIAQDLDLNFEQSVSLFFDPLAMEMARTTVKGPVYRGRLIYDQYGSPAEFLPDPLGNVSVWSQMVDGRIAPSRYVIGVDVAAGTGTDWSSNSVIEVIDLTTGEQVLEWADNATRPEDCAALAVATAKWLQGESGSQPYLVWEAQGPGGEFYREVAELGYTNIYNRPPSHAKKRINARVSGHKAGYIGAKADALTPLQVAIKLRRVTLFSENLVKELAEYRYTAGGKVDHFRATSSEEDSSKGQLHGDRAMAFAMAVIGMNDFISMRRKEKEPTPEQRQGHRLRKVIRELREERWKDEVVFD